MIGAKTILSITCVNINPAIGNLRRMCVCNWSVKCNIRSCVSRNVNDTSVVVAKKRKSDEIRIPILKSMK